MGKSDIPNILRSKATVFTFKDILLATDEVKPLLLKRRLSYYINKGELDSALTQSEPNPTTSAKFASPI